MPANSKGEKQQLYKDYFDTNYDHGDHLMPEIRATIAHISDLHFGWYVDQQLLAELKKIVKEISPQFLVVSGDLAENPFPWSMEKACRYIREIMSECLITPERAIIIPGNHDYKLWGNVGLGRLTRIPFEIFFRRDGLLMSAPRRWLLYARLVLSALWPQSRELRDTLEIKYNEEFGIAFFGFNSTPLFQTFASGKVREECISTLSHELREKCEESKEWERFLKVAVVHHHPIPIAYVSTKLKARVEASLMVFYNAGTFLRELGRSGIDLILHGHKHYGGFARVSYNLTEGERCQIGILAAGSATHKKPSDPSGNHFNVIQIYEDDTITVEQRYYSADVPRKDSSETDYFLDFADIRDRRNDLAQKRYGMTIGQVNKTVRLTYGGYSEIEERFLNCRIYGDTYVDGYDIDLKAPAPCYIRKAGSLPERSTCQFPELKIDEEESHLRHLKGKFAFGEERRATDGPFDLAYSCRLMNSHALNSMEFKRKYADGRTDYEYTNVFCTQAASSLKLKVIFPEGFNMKDIQEFGAECVYLPSPIPASEKSLYKQHNEETNRIKDMAKCKLSPRRRFLELEVPAPVPLFVYRIRWKYGVQQLSGVKRIHAREGLSRHVRERLIATAGEAVKEPNLTPLYNDIVKALKLFLVDVESFFEPLDLSEELHISLGVFDDRESKLRFVAANFGKIDELFNERLAPGEGCAGFSFDKNSILFYDCTRDEIGYYIKPDELKKEREDGTTALLDYKILLTIPWIDSPGIEVGVICIGSTSEASRFLRFFDMGEEKQKEAFNKLSNLTKVFGGVIIKKILRYGVKE